MPHGGDVQGGPLMIDDRVNGEDAMNPGPELDRLIAEKVMGWVESGRCWSGEDEAFLYYVNTPDLVDSGELANAWAPSVDIECAWRVAEKLRFCVVPLEVYDSEAASESHGAWAAGVDGQSVIADTAPLAICLAALKVVEKS